MAGKFVDTNVLLYLVEPSNPKYETAKQILLGEPTISVQVLNEFVRVCLGKFKSSIEATRLALAPIRYACRIVPVTADIHDLAFEILRVHKIGIYDACIVAAAEISGSDVLYTEDMNHGQQIGRVVIRNPFA